MVGLTYHLLKSSTKTKNKINLLGIGPFYMGAGHFLGGEHNEIIYQMQCSKLFVCWVKNRKDSDESLI